jgi:uncharacterized protein with von Willebrand factor type A (vWA) domain
VLRYKDFGELTDDERAEMLRFLERFSWPLPPRRVRRLRPGRGPRLDLRRTLRSSLRRGGEVLGFARRRPRIRARPLVVLADVSGSMEPYARLLLVFARALAASHDARVEAFVFGTRLTRVTRALRTGDPEAALRAVAQEAPDWGGGTRMGDALRAFNLRWSRRIRAGGAVVLLISDGWDRGDPDLLGEEMARLQRSCHRLVWLNPLLGAPDYEPLVRGLRVALPFVDDFLPIQHLASLEDLAQRLSDLPLRRRHA